jgi:hypothetical protein
VLTPGVRTNIKMEEDWQREDMPKTVIKEEPK